MVFRRSAKMQVMLKQALEDWFTFARKGLRGVSVPDLVDSIIMLGLNPDYRQVRSSHHHVITHRVHEMNRATRRIFYGTIAQQQIKSLN